MRALWVDPSNGCAGDMLLAALLDAGASADAVRAGLRNLGVEGIGLDPAGVRRHGFRALLAGVTAAHEDVERTLPDVLKILSLVPARVREFAEATFARLAAAEARVHGIAAEQVHFHEVGALDAIADVVGCAYALDDLGLLATGTQRVVGPVAVGSGVGQTAHGRLPVPAPAVLELLVGAPIAAHPAAMELCTPTGAALLATLATGWGPPPALTVEAVGVGAGTRDPQSHPNVVRVLVGSSAEPAATWRLDSLHEVQATIDDLDPRVWPDLLERLRTAGAADAWCTPALMRKGRPGQVLSVLVDAERLDLVCRLIFTETTTLGLRVRGVERRALARDQVQVSVAGQPVGVKRGFLGDQVVTVQPEYDDAVIVSVKTGLPLADVLGQAAAAARSRAAGTSDA
jgi:pyridinium-3,5-bisthiocarboxylic acid mononucleotide nickel chelatase